MRLGRLPVVLTLLLWVACGGTTAIVETPPRITSTPGMSAVVGERYEYTVVYEGWPAPELEVTGDEGEPLPSWLAFDPERDVLSGTPGPEDLGEHTVVIHARNGHEPDARQSFTITVTAEPVEEEAPAITSTPVTEVVAGQTYTYALEATGTPRPYLTVAGAGGEALPGWLSFDEGSETLAGIPGDDDVGEHAVVVTATNGVSPDAVQSFTIRVDAAPVDPVAPSITSTPDTEVVEGEAYAYTVTATGYPAPTFTATGPAGAALPGWLSFDGASATLSGTPAAEDIGEHSVEITATNGVSPDAVQSFTLTVLQAPEAPVITSTPATEVVEGEAYAYTVTATGHPAPTFTATGPAGAALPAWLSFDAASATLSGTPNAGDVGAHELEITATNGVDPDAVQAFTLTVHLAPFAPQITSTPDTEVVEGQAYAYTVTATSHPAPTFTATGPAGAALPAWLSFDAASATLSGTPATADIGDHAVEITAANGVSPDAAQTFTITVLQAPEAPAITSTPDTEVIEGEAYTYTVTATGHPAPTFTATGPAGAALPAWLSFDAATATLSGTPATADIGDHAVEITAENGVSPDAVQTFTITVLQAPEAPTITSTAPGTGQAGATWSYTITAEGHPAPSLSVSGLPSWMTFDGVDTLSGTPDGLDVGATAPITVTASNGVSPNATEVFTVAVAPAAAVPVTGELVEDFGTTLPAGWSARGDWAFGIPTVGPSTLFDGELAGTALHGNYADLTLHSLATPVLDLSAVDEPVLRFHHWYAIESNLWDGANVKVSTDGGVTWLELPEGTVEPGYTGLIQSGYQNPLAGEAGWSGTTPGWVEVEVDLATALAGLPTDQVVIRFDLGADSMINAAGWYVDAVYIGEADAPEGPPVGLVTYTFEGNVKTAATLDADLTADLFDNRDGDAIFAAGNGGGVAILSANWHEAGNPNYFEFTVAPGPGYQVRLGALSFDERASSTGPTWFQVYRVVDGTVTAVTGGAGNPLHEEFPQPSPMVTVPFSRTDWGPYDEPVTLRIVAGGASTGGGTWRLDNVSLEGWMEMVAPEAPAITSTAPTEGEIGVPYAYTFTVEGSPPPEVVVSGLPEWLTFDGVDTLSGTPTAFDVGTHGPISITATNPVGQDQQTFSVQVDPPPPVAVAPGSPLIEGFGSALPSGWSASGDWEFGLHTHGPAVAFDGELAATRLHSDYTTSTWSRLQTPPLDLTAVSQAMVRFQHWHNIETGAYDGANVKVSTDGGITFFELIPSTVTPAYHGPLRAGIPMSDELAWYGESGGWQTVLIDLEANLAGEPRGQVVIAFDLGTDYAINRPGWYLDDVEIGDGVDVSVPPEITSAPLRSVVQGSFYFHAVTTEGAPAPVVSVGGLPSWLSFDPGTAELYGVPGAADVGSHPLEITATNAAGAVTQSFDLVVLPAGMGAILEEDFEGDPLTAGWAIGHDVGTGSDWQIGVPTAGPAGAHSGAQCAGTILAGFHTSNENRLSYLQTPLLDLSGTGHPVLRFHHWHRIHPGTGGDAWDGGNVKISTDGGITFAELVPSSVTPAYPGPVSTLYGNPLAGQLAWSGTTADWVAVEIDLAENLDGLPWDEVVIRFDFGAENFSKSYEGWYVDDVVVGDRAVLP